ncbi:MAG TPA: type II toxin-antitoxin system prevent-host-death family antitoxin [Gemmatimonadaceae bacterium]
MKTVNMHEAKTHLSRLVEEAAAGEEIVIARAGKPLVRLVAVSASEGPRKLGSLAGKVVERDDAWAPDPGLESMFYAVDVEPPRAKRVPGPAPKQMNPGRRKKK